MRTRAIDRFTGAHAFLSNFFACDIEFEGDTYATVEHAFQAAKTSDADSRARIRAAPSPRQAKRLGRRVPLRPDWERVKVRVMEDLVLQKFSAHDALRVKLLDTGDRELVEGNSWNDTFWGVCRGRGRNELGRILMDVRARQRAGDHSSDSS